MRFLSDLAVEKPKGFMYLAAFLSLFFALGVAMPSFAPEQFPYFSAIEIDTDPENMLSADEDVRAFHNARKAEYNLYDIIIVGVENKENSNGVFNVKSLRNIYELVEYIKGVEGVVETEIISLSNVDNIEQDGSGSVRFEWLMKIPPKTEDEAQEIADKAADLPLLNNSLISGDKKSVAIYIPIISKNISYKVSQLLREKVDMFEGSDIWHITGLPVAQDRFGVEMFVQMAVSAPMAMLLIFALMWYFFRSVRFVISPMIVALVSVIVTMGTLVMSGHTVHIMSSMIPIFIMPIAVLDSVHILSDFFDVYPKYANRRKTVMHVMRELSAPMLFTSLTTAAGFASLVFTPIPPVQVFGAFIAFGVLAAWIFTITLVPAYIMLLPEKSLEGFGLQYTVEERSEEGQADSVLVDLLHKTGQITYSYAKVVLIVMLMFLGASIYGIGKIEINDNPVKWFAQNHEIRVADRAMNASFAGTYMAYLELRPKLDMKEKFVEALYAGLGEGGAQEELLKSVLPSFDGDINAIKDFIYKRQADVRDDKFYYEWENIASFVDEIYGDFELFKQPEMLRFVEKVQEYLLSSGLVGKINALPDIIKTVHRELHPGDEGAFIIPDSRNAVAQTLMTYQNSHRPDDLWHFTTPSYDKTVLWLQLKSGDNKDMNKVVRLLDEYMEQNEAPFVLEHEWFGLTYINVIWQEKMVAGMKEAFSGSFVIVLVMMIILFRSFFWGVLSMIPLSVTIAFIYGIIGFIGKDYDMPVAVLSSLSLGLAVDYAIHFLARSREALHRVGRWNETIRIVFGEPARAIVRNVIVIGVGFTPLLFAPLVPYNTVGFFISAILLFAGIATLLILPSMVSVFEKFLVRRGKKE